jgi:hypothetical protein
MARLTATLLALTAALVLATSAGALTSTESNSPIGDQGSSYHYRSYITSVTPTAPGLSVEVLEFADRLLLTNRTGRTVTIYGYQGDPYARLRSDGTVEVNTRSPAYYLNQSFYGNITVPASANPDAAPHWVVDDRTGQFEWHDHRIHWASPTLPPEVKDKGRRTLIFNWQVPIRVGTQAGAVHGQLFWTPESSRASTAVIVLGVAIALLGVLCVLFVRRRRARAGTGPGEASGGGASPDTGIAPGAIGARENSGEEAW